MQILKDKLIRAFELTKDLAMHLDEDALKLHLSTVPSNTIGGQLWCIVGARESYIKAVERGIWSGFSCSLKDPSSKNEVLKCLDHTYNNLLDFIDQNLTETQTTFLFDLLEHEIQHHGQLMRFVYGNHLTFPISWKKRYTV